MKKAVISSLFLLLAFSIVGCRETTESYFGTYENAVFSGAFEGDWIPKWLLPKSAVEIREIHNMDTNQSMLAFRFSPAEEIKPGKWCVRINHFQPKALPFNVSWWPSDVPANTLSSYRHSFWSCEGGKAFLAMSQNLGEAFYWRPQGN